MNPDRPQVGEVWRVRSGQDLSGDKIIVTKAEAGFEWSGLISIIYTEGELQGIVGNNWSEWHFLRCFERVT